MSHGRDVWVGSKVPMLSINSAGHMSVPVGGDSHQRGPVIKFPWVLL
jgi:hypothetical protein